MAKYVAKQDIHFSSTGRYVFAGEAFESDEVPGLQWEPVDAAAKASAAKRFDAKSKT